MIGGYYKSIAECPLNVFISVLVSGDLRNLKKWGFVTAKKLVEVWDNLFDEYLKETNQAQYSILLRKMKDIAITKNKIRLAIGVVSNLELRYNEKLVECLRLLGYRYKFDPKDSDKYFKDLERVRKDIKNLIVINKELEEKLRGKEKDSVREQDFDSLLVELGRFQGYRLEKNKITVSEFLQILKNYKTINSKKNGKHGTDR